MLKIDADTKNNPDATGGCWPTPRQTLLLQAALLPRAPAVAAWHAWRQAVDIETDHLDLGSYRLLPLVYDHLKSYVPEDPLMGRLRGLHHRTWVENQFQLRACAAVLTDLQAAGIETLVLKGTALSAEYYPTHGVRPMWDFDVLIPTPKTAAAIAVLSRAGWQPVAPPDARLTQSYLAIHHGQGFANAEGRQLDLHWHVLANALDETVDEHFWAGSVPLNIRGVATRALNPTDLFLHVCAHGVAWSSVPPVRWVADAMMILRNAEDRMDWDRLLWMAEQCQSSLALHAALRYLQETLAAPIPPDVPARMAANPVSSQERRFFAAQTRRYLLLGALPLLWARYQLYLTQARASSRFHGLLGFPRYVALCKNIGPQNSVLRWMLEKSAKRLAMYVRREWRWGRTVTSSGE